MATSIELDDDLVDRVRELAGRRQSSPSSIMREAIRDYVAREEARESFHQEALASWAEYQRTGRHLTGEEARAWIATWGTEHEVPLPECHE